MEGHTANASKTSIWNLAVAIETFYLTTCSTAWLKRSKDLVQLKTGLKRKKYIPLGFEGYVGVF